MNRCSIDASASGDCCISDSLCGGFDRPGHGAGLQPGVDAPREVEHRAPFRVRPGAVGHTAPAARAQLLGGDLAVGQPLDGGAVFERHAATPAPVRRGALHDAERGCEFSDAADDANGFCQVVHAAILNTDVIEKQYTHVFKFAHKITPVKTLQDRLKHARKMRGLTQAQLASMIPCRQSTIGNIEAGRNESVRDVTAFARVLRVPAEWLAEGKGPMPTADGTIAINHPTRTGAGRRSSDNEAWPFTAAREDLQLLTPEQIAAVDAVIKGFLPTQTPQRRHGSGA